jgi:hypothetical protein
MKKFLAAIALLAGLGFEARAQTISPVIQEYQQKADSRFQIFNDADVPLAVTLEPYSFTVDSNGSPTFRKLDDGIHIQLSATSFRIQPRQTYYVFYKATAEALPAWFCIYATVTGPSAPNGLKLAFKLPHTVYLLDKTSLERGQITWVRAETTLEGDHRKIVAEIQNQGPALGRVREILIDAGPEKQTLSGFPIFPGQKRLISIDWEHAAMPRRIALSFDNFKTEADLKTISATTSMP